MATGVPTEAISESESLYEIVNGERREVPPMGAVAGILASVLAQYLNAFALPQKLGLAVVEVLFALRSGAPSRRPDVAFVRYDHWPITAAPSDDPPALQLAPDLAVEVVSPNDIADELDEKIEEYFAAGVAQVWVVYPVRRRIYVYQSPTQVRILLEKDDLDGGPVLPGFRLSVATMFGGLVKPN